MRDTVSSCRRAFALIAAVPLVLVALLASGCEPQDPEERISELRGRYEVTLNNWFIRREPPPPTPEESTAAEAEGDGESAAAEGDAGAAASGEGTPEEAGETTAEGEDEIVEEDLGPKLRDVLLDIEIWHDARESLPGITLEVTQADASENEKATYRIWVDTSALPPGTHRQVNHVFEDIEVAEDDQFSVELRHPVPPAERDEYREFQQAGQSADEASAL